MRLLFHYLTGFIADDALTTFRYAENLISGKGFVYNAGERVLGTTTPLLTLILSVFLLLKMPPFNAALLISLTCSGLTAIVMYRFAQHLRFSGFSFVPALTYILWPRSIVTDTCGLETSLFTLIIISAWYFQHRKLWFYSVGLATLACVTRPEGFLLLGILLIHNCLKDRKNLRAYLIVPAIIIIPWLAFSYAYFDTIVPTSITGKLALYSHTGTESLLEKLVYLLGLHSFPGWAMLSVSTIGGWWLLRKQNFGKLEIIWLMAMIAFYTFSRTELFFWYVVPIYPLYIIFSSAAIPFIWDRFGFRTDKKILAQLVLAVTIAAGLIYMCNPLVAFYKEYARYLKEVHKSIGLYLRDNANPHDTVSAKYIGNTGYYSQLKVQDRDGMINPSAADYNRRGDYLGLVLDNQPEWVVAAPNRKTEEFANHPDFLSQYQLVKSFGWDDKVRHNLYKKTN